MTRKNAVCIIVGVALVTGAVDFLFVRPSPGYTVCADGKTDACYAEMLKECPNNKDYCQNLRVAYQYKKGRDIGYDISAEIENRWETEHPNQPYDNRDQSQMKMECEREEKEQRWWHPND